MLLKELPTTERPRERGIKYGVNNLSTSELLAIILRTGSPKHSVMETATLILSKLQNASDLNFLTLQELTKIEGIGSTKAITILACIELGKRLNNVSIYDIKFNNAVDVFNFFKNETKFLKEEHLYVLYLDSKSKLIEKKLLTIGSNNRTIIDNKLIFKWAYKLSASAFILVHNHPSGITTPSHDDTIATKLLKKQADALDLVFIDHIIIGYNYYSFRENTNIFN